MTIAAPQQRFMPWYGANTANAEPVGELLDECHYVVILFCAGMAEVPHIRARQIVCNDRHRDVIALASCVRNPLTRRILLASLRWTVFHPESLRAAQQYMLSAESLEIDGTPEQLVARASAYFVTQWMGRSARAGTLEEFRGKLPIRTNGNGGASGVRYWSAVRGLAEWGQVFRRCEFTCLDWRHVLDEYGADLVGHGIYADPPWPGAGDKYRHKFTPADHVTLRDRLSAYGRARVVVRYGVHPVIERLYLAESQGWSVHEVRGRAQSRKGVPELLLVRN